MQMGPLMVGASLPLISIQVVLEVKEAIEELQPGTTTYNSCLLNLYKDGNHHVSWHSDNESV